MNNRSIDYCQTCGNRSEGAGRKYGLPRNRGGTYALILQANAVADITAGRLGIHTLIAGYYVYVGSAFGPGGLAARIAHHQRCSDKPHWHIDYIRPYAHIAEIWFNEDSNKREHAWAQALAQIPGMEIGINGFGASDCRCRSHLFYRQKKPYSGSLLRALQRQIGDHGRIHVMRQG